MKLGLCTISAKRARVETIIRRAAAIGYDGIEIWGKNHIDDGSPAHCAEIKAVAERCNIDIGIYGSYLRAGNEEFTTEMNHELDVTAALGAEKIRIWAGAVDYEERTVDHWESTIDDVRTLVAEAAARDLEVTVERHDNTVTNTTEGARRLIEAIDHDNCGLNWQPLFTQSAEEIISDARELAPFSNNVHLQAVPTRDESDRCLLEDAYFDIPAVIAMLRDSGYEKYVELEFVTEALDHETAIEHEYAYLKTALES